MEKRERERERKSGKKVENRNWKRNDGVEEASAINGLRPTAASVPSLWTDTHTHTHRLMDIRNNTYSENRMNGWWCGRALKRLCSVSATEKRPVSIPSGGWFYDWTKRECGKHFIWIHWMLGTESVVSGSRCLGTDNVDSRDGMPPVTLLWNLIEFSAYRKSKSGSECPTPLGLDASAVMERSAH